MQLSADEQQAAAEFKASQKQQRELRPFMRELGVDFGNEQADLVIKTLGDKLLIDSVRTAAITIVLEAFAKQKANQRELGSDDRGVRLFATAGHRAFSSRLKFHAAAFRRSAKDPNNEP